MLHAVGMSQACVQRWKNNTVYPKEADDGAEMLDTYTKPDRLVIPGSNVMSFLIELQIKHNGNIKKKKFIGLEKEKTLQEVPLELVLRRCKASHIDGSCQHGDCACSKDIEIGKYMSLGGMVLGCEEGWNLSLKV